MQVHQETQSDLHNISMGQVQNIKKLNPPQRVGNEPLPPIKKYSDSTGDNKENRKKTEEGVVILGDSTNVVKIKPKRSSSNFNMDKNSQNSVQPLQKQDSEKIKLNQSKLRATEQLKTSKITMRPREFFLTPTQANEITKFTIDRQTGIFKNAIEVMLQGKTSRSIVMQKKFTLIGNKIILKLPENLELKSIGQIEHLSEKLTNPVLGCLESNYDGSIFNLYEADQTEAKNQIIATFHYFSDVGKIGGPRKVKIFIKDHTVPHIITNLQPDENLKQLVDRLGSTPAVHCYSSMVSKHDKDSDTYGLNFNCTKQVLPSVHNMILVNEELTPIIKLFKSDISSYDLELRHPIIPLVGCAFAISSFLFKFASQ